MHICYSYIIIIAILLSYILLNLSNLAIWFLAMQMFLYFQYIFEIGQVRQEVNGGLILDA